MKPLIIIGRNADWDAIPKVDAFERWTVSSAYFDHPKETASADKIFQIVSRRSELTSTIITTNLRPSQWGKIFESGTATAILDRLSLNGSFMTCEGDSYRRRKK